ncbi:MULTISPECIES: hypothetical protein [Metabacillus]|uniref:Uncharacterized protein n=1 Tax=Metabacillus rhizolycopersici TaxID=2875709 RepID=A0ABS7UQP8_9BACI|nr:MULTISPECIES: hypothetical protein [Metabacillus]MBZ5750544.1 hypothetical protein [Metabacillus rhizolycopersici]MCM3653199.1 hypothetical protein [Metabacillus litoralis]
MKQYIFTVNTNKMQRELIINAKGITDAVEQVKLIMKFARVKNSTQAKNIQFKGIKY